MLLDDNKIEEDQQKRKMTIKAQSMRLKIVFWMMAFAIIVTVLLWRLVG